MLTTIIVVVLQARGDLVLRWWGLHLSVFRGWSSSKISFWGSAFQGRLFLSLIQQQNVVWDKCLCWGSLFWEVISRNRTGALGSVKQGRGKANKGCYPELGNTAGNWGFLLPSPSEKSCRIVSGLSVWGKGVRDFIHWILSCTDESFPHWVLTSLQL